MEHRKLLPKPRLRDGDQLLTPPGSAFAGLVPKKKKAAGRSACDPCRSRKSACDGKKPTCSTCRIRSTECIYKERTVPDEITTEILGLLKTWTKSEALDLLHRLRNTAVEPPTPASSSSFSEQYETTPTPELLKRYSPKPALAPKASGIELELQVRYPVAYPCLCPTDVAPWLLDAVSGPSSSGPTTHYALRKHSSDSSWMSDAQDTTLDSPRTAGHISPKQAYCDPRLSRVDIGKWTDVIVDDALAAGALSFYLETDYPIHGLFDADLFLHDLVSGEHNFCSPMLVNAVLGWSCRAYSATESTASAYKTIFFEEGMRRWEQEEHRNRLTSVAAAHLLSMTATCHGRDDVAFRYLREAIALGHRMGLYGQVEETSAKTWLDNHHTWIRAASHTAWGGYCSITHHSLQYHKPLVERPPLLPIPGQVGSLSAGRTKSERYDSYPMPIYAGQTFNKLCELFQIAHKLLWAYYDGEGTANNAPATRVSVEFAEGLYRELLAWAASLPLDLVRADTNEHHIVVLHTYFHCLVLDIFRPFLDMQTIPPLGFLEGSQSNGDVEVVSRASVNQLKRLVFFYLSKFDATAYSAVWRPALIYVLNSLIRDARLSPEPHQSREWTFYFRACMFGLSKQLCHSPLVDKIIQGILAMATRDYVISKSDANRILENMRREVGMEAKLDNMFEIAAAGAATGLEGSFIVDLDLASRDPPAAMVDVLVEDFGDLAVLADAASMVMDA